MKNFRIISRLDIKGENLIKGIRLEGLRKLGDPYLFALDYFKNHTDEIKESLEEESTVEESAEEETDEDEAA